MIRKSVSSGSSSSLSHPFVIEKANFCCLIRMRGQGCCSGHSHGHGNVTLLSLKCASVSSYQQSWVELRRNSSDCASEAVVRLRMRVVWEDFSCLCI